MSSNKRLRGVSVFRPIIVGNTAILIPPEERGESDHTHRWTIAVRSATAPAALRKSPADSIGGADDLSYFIKKVTFKLHETYPTPLRSIEKAPFEVTETGWGEFDIIVKIFFASESNEKPITFNHHLKLHPWPIDAASGTALLPGALGGTGAIVVDSNPAETTAMGLAPVPAAVPTTTAILSPVHSWQYEELIFAEPTESFYSLLLSHPPTPLPRLNRHIRNLPHALGAGGNSGEFSSEMEAEEGGRLERARGKTLEEIERLRKRLIGNEKELGLLRKEVEDLTAAAAASAAMASESETPASAAAVSA